MSAEASGGSMTAASAHTSDSQAACQNPEPHRNVGLLGSKYVKLNVGGSLHYTTVQTLSKEDSLLRSMCNGGTEVTLDSEGNYLRSTQHFTAQVLSIMYNVKCIYVNTCEHEHVTVKAIIQSLTLTHCMLFMLTISVISSLFSSALVLKSFIRTQL